MFFWNSCFFNDPADVGNLISGSSAFSKTSFNIWKFTVHILLKPGLENFEHYFTSVWDECNCVVSSVQFSSVAQSFPTLCDPMNCSTSGLPIHHQHPEFTETHVHWVSDAIQSSHPLSSPSPPAPSIRVFSSGSVLHIRWPKYWIFSFNISPSNEYSGLISFRLHWLDLLAVQGTLSLPYINYLISFGERLVTWE